MNTLPFSDRNNHLNSPVATKLTSEVKIICDYMEYIRLHVSYTLDVILDTYSVHTATKK